MPPLRERLEDLPLLVEHVRRTTNVRHGVAIDGVTDGALHHLAAFPWPGNVLELEAVLEEAMLLQGHGWLGADSLALSGSGATPVRPATPGPASSVLDRAVRQRLALDLAAEPGGVSTGRFARACAVSLTLARRDLGALVGQGRLRRIGRGRAVHYVVR